MRKKGCFGTAGFSDVVLGIVLSIAVPVVLGVVAGTAVLLSKLKPAVVIAPAVSEEKPSAGVSDPTLPPDEKK